jgi:predicted DNA-binding transcriptional regulator YafY
VPFGVSQNFLDRLKQRIQTYWKQPGEEAQPGVDPRLVGPATGIDQIMYRIRLAGRTRTLLWMKYNNSQRFVEPYSFRARANPGPQPLFFGWCGLHDEIHSFRIDRIQDVHNTDRPFAPRFPVEIG